MRKRTRTQQRPLIFALFCAVLLAGCGQKGPLHLPEPAEQTEPSESTQSQRLLAK